jgi:sugar/nucleoside kinase (ribokinase family)
MLCCIGDLVEDVVVWPEITPRRGTDTPSRVFRHRGGSAANVAVLAATAGGRSRFVGQIGNDRLGELLVEDLVAAGVEPIVARTGRTGTIVVLIEADGERTMLPDRAAATQLSEIPPHTLDDVSWLHVPGYSLMVEPLGGTSRALIEAARSRDIKVSVDASSVSVIEEYGISAFTGDLERLEPDVLFCNEEEAHLLDIGSGASPPGVQLAVVKAGPDPVCLVDIHTATWVPVPRVDAVTDTTGAGDAFAAGFIVATMGGAKPVQATRAGNSLAAQLLKHPGADVRNRQPVPEER